MAAWYCNINYTTTRRTNAEFKDRKLDGRYRFNVMPAINFMDGSQMGQTQSMLRWIGQSCNGRRGEILYPFPMNPEACYDIDSLVEISQDYILKLGRLYISPEITDYKAWKQA